MPISAVVSLADLGRANALLESWGFGPRNFSRPVYSSGTAPTHATLHAWGGASFINAVKSLADGSWADPSDPLAVEWSETGAAPSDRVSNALATVSGRWAGSAQKLTGVVTPGLYLHEGDYWWVISEYNTSIWSNPRDIPNLIRRARVPGRVEPWSQLLDQFDAYKLVNPFTGRPDRVMHKGQTWEVSRADAAGNNVWEPGVFGWIAV